MLVTWSDLEASLAALHRQIPDSRAGILGPDSIAWQLNGDLATFLGGGRAALLQLAHPMVAYAIAEHSATRADVAARFQRTFRHVYAMLFGALDDAFAAARRVHAIHATIHGTLPEAAGRWPAGTPYHAGDAEVLRWVHATLVDTTLAVRERLAGPLAPAVKDRYVVEMNRFAALFGIPDPLLPGGHAAHAAYMRAMLASDQLAVAPCARAMARFLVGRGGAHQPALGWLAETVTAALLPAPLVEQFALRPAPRRARTVLAVARAVHRGVPPALCAIPARAAAQHRLRGTSPGRVGRWIGCWIDRRLLGLVRRTAGGDSAVARPALKMR